MKSFSQVLLLSASIIGGGVKHSITLAILLVVTGIGINAHAGSILQATGVSTNMGSIYPVIGTINQSGLSTGYTSLVDDFDTYIATNPTHDHGFGGNIWGSPQDIRSGYLDFTLGGDYVIESMAFWTLDADPSSIRQFKLYADDNLSFSSATLLGSYTALNSPGFNPSSVQVFSFSAQNASYVRLEVLNTWSTTSYSTALGEVAFEISAVPEPETYAMMLAGLGLIGFVARRRRQQAA